MWASIKERLKRLPLVRSCGLRGYRLLRERRFFHKLSHFPRLLQIEPTNACNYDCVFCPRELQTRKIGMMKPETLQRIIDESVYYGKRHILTVQGFGEPLLNKQFPDFLRYCKTKDAAEVISFNTTAYFLTEDVSRRIIQSGIDQFHVSVDGVTNDHYRELKGITDRDALDRIKKNLRAFMRIRQEMGRTKPRLIVDVIEMDSTRSFLEEFKKTWEEIADEMCVKPLHNWDGSPEYVGSQDGQRYPCYYLWSQLEVLQNGDVVPCCMDFDGKGVLGNVQQQSLREIWRSPKLNEWRKLHLAGRAAEIPLCAQCEKYRDYPDMTGQLRKYTKWYGQP